MPVTIILDDELAQRLERQAHAHRTTLQQWALEILNRAPEFPDQPQAWRELNARRFELIHKRHHEGLSESEEAELAELQATTDRWLEPVDRQRLDRLKAYEELAQQLTRPSDE
jgi:hypothetical protein